MKKELLDLFGKKPEDDYIRAKNRVLTGKPSQLGKLLIDDICKKDKKLDGCCCANTCWAMFREQLPVTVRNHISDYKFTKDTYKDVFARADQVFASNKAPEPNPRPTVAAVKPDQAGAAADVAAVGLGRGRNRRNRGGQTQQPSTRSRPAASNTNTTSSTTQPSKPKGTRHPTAKGKDESLCKIHFQWGENGTYCAAPWKCPMKDTWKAPQ